jgi:predicted RNase H-like HicB family nuclease
MFKPKYHINVFYSKEDKAFIADVPDLKYCSAHGSTPEKAVREIQIAMTAWLRSAKKSGIKIPKPRYRPAIYQVAS